ncbi:hypothetical protein AHAS_Ahas12G0169600 [Arachis hypogaea]
MNEIQDLGRVLVFSLGMVDLRLDPFCLGISRGPFSAGAVVWRWRWKQEGLVFWLIFWIRLRCSIVVSALIVRHLSENESQDVTYKLGLPIDRQFVSKCLMDFQWYIDDGHLTWVWIEDLLGVLPPPGCIDKFTVRCTSMQEMFGDTGAGGDAG